MAEATKLNAVLRATESNGKSGGGKGNARATRRAGNVPAVIYGNNEAPILISLDINKLTPIVMRGGFLTHTLELELDGKSHHVLPRDVQFDPVKDFPLHVDFLRVTDRTEIRLQIPVTFTNTAAAIGLKKGGVMNVVAHEIGFFAKAGAIPESIEVDVGGLDIGDSLHLSQVTLPKGLRLINPSEASMTVVTIGAPTAEAEIAPTAEAAPAAAPAKGKGGKAAPAAAAAAPAAAAAKPAAKKK